MTPGVYKNDVVLSVLKSDEEQGARKRSLRGLKEHKREQVCGHFFYSYVLAVFVLHLFLDVHAFTWTI